MSVAAHQARAADLTRSREELRAAHQRVSAMFRSAPTGMIQLDAGGRVLAVNPAFSEFAIPVPSGTVALRGFSRFVETRGGDYFFLPSLQVYSAIAGGQFR